MEESPLKIIINKGKVIKAEGKLKDAFEALINQDDRLLNIAEIGIGTNSYAILGRSVLEDEKKIGTAHIGFGNDTYFGGSVYGPHLDGVFARATIAVDQKPLMRDGILLK